MQQDAINLNEFEQIVSQVLADLPEWVQLATSDIAIMVDDLPPADWHGQGILLGQFHGIANTANGGRVPGSLPNRIELYRVPILQVCDSRDDIATRVRRVLGHEIGHAFGLSEYRLRQLGWH